MKIKVYTDNVKLTIKDDFDLAKEWFKNRAKLDVSFEFAEVKVKNRNLTFMPLVNAYQVDTINNQISFGNEDISIYAFNADDFDVLTTSAYIGFAKQFIPLISLKTSSADDSSGWIWKSIIHEMMHALFMKAYFAGHRGLVDQMDKTYVNGEWISYYKNGDPYADDGNHAISLRILEPYLKQLRSVSDNKIILTRLVDNGKQTLGKLNVFGTVFDTLELSWQDNKKNISCVPKGEYNLVYTFSPRFMKYTYELQNVKNRSGIRIHGANYFFQLNGCIALGSGIVDINKDGNLDVLNSKLSISKFESLIKGKDITLIIQ